ncbi:MAG TPA: SCO1664 family protein [Anaerolineae bacterium]|nr:SCO1664 family protein [Anaerolineae bacterium]
MAADAASAPQPISIDQLLDLLANGQIEQQGLLPWGSNYTFLVSVMQGDVQIAAIYKPRDGERPLWDFPEGTLCQREAAAFVVSQALDWLIVPPTVLRDGPHGVGMVQFYIDCNPDEHYFTLKDDERFTGQFQRIALFDLLINNADRKSGHCLRADDDHIWAIDHGVAFSVEPKLRTVIWDFAEQDIPEALRADLRSFRARLDQPGDSAAKALSRLLDKRELAALKRRADQLIQTGCFPRPLPGYRQIPWPPV